AEVRIGSDFEILFDCLLQSPVNARATRGQKGSGKNDEIRPPGKTFEDAAPLTHSAARPLGRRSWRAGLGPSWPPALRLRAGESQRQRWTDRSHRHRKEAWPLIGSHRGRRPVQSQFRQALKL